VIEKLIEQMIFLHWFTQPDVVAEKSDGETKQRIGNNFCLVIAAQLFRSAGVMNIADDENCFALHQKNFNQPRMDTNSHESKLKL
jgi:hypothetical protein